MVQQVEHPLLSLQRFRSLLWWVQSLAWRTCMCHRQPPRPPKKERKKEVACSDLALPLDGTISCRNQENKREDVYINHGCHPQTSCPSMRIHSYFPDLKSQFSAYHICSLHIYLTLEESQINTLLKSEIMKGRKAYS